MSFLEVLEVAIGLVFVWLVMSIAVMQTQEWIVGWLAIRADGLEEAIWGLLADPKPALNAFRRAGEQARKIANRRFGVNLQLPGAPPLVKELYQHPLIKGLAQGKSKPSYIPADKFALALFDVVMTAGTDESVVQQAIGQLEHNLNNLEVKLTPDQVKGLRKTLGRLLKQEGDTFQVALKDLKSNHPHIDDELTRLLGVNETDVEKIKTTLEYLRGQLEYLKVSPNPKHVVMLQTALEQVKDIGQVNAVFDRLRRQRPDIEPVLDSAKEVLDAFLRAKPPQDEDEMLARIVNGAAALAVSNPGLKRTLDDLVANAKTYATVSETAIVVARTNVETWFNNAMDRANGWYKRNRQVGAFVIALILAALINVDSINIATHLWREPTLRQAVVAQAERYKLPAADTQEQTPLQDVGELETTFNELQQSLKKLDLPIGWKKTPQDWGILSTIGGLIITAAAATLGAPYWFDILQKLIGIRSTGKVPEPDGASRR